MYVRWLKGGLWYLGLVCPVKEQLQRQMARHHMQAQLHGIGQQLIKSVVKEEVEEDEEEGLGWGENVEGEEMEEVVEEDPPPFHDVWTKGDMAAVKAAVGEGKKKEVEVVEIGGEDEEEEDEKNEKKNWGGGGKSGGGKSGGGKSGGGKSGGRKVLAPWAKQRKDRDKDDKRDWVVKVDEWGGKRFNSGWYHYQGKWYPILVHDKVYKVFFQFERCCMGHLCEFTVFLSWLSIVMYLS